MSLICLSFLLYHFLSSFFFTCIPVPFTIVIFLYCFCLSPSQFLLFSNCLFSFSHLPLLICVSISLNLSFILLCRFMLIMRQYVQHVYLQLKKSSLISCVQIALLALKPQLSAHKIPRRPRQRSRPLVSLPQTTN